ncbi:zinc ABC transporter substrate-binding protein AztC [Arthrobacter glacialis]|nr:zinc ABC transporter substrate-binding protein AztC [Arthrobacter glacialis]
MSGRLAVPWQRAGAGRRRATIAAAALMAAAGVLTSCAAVPAGSEKATIMVTTNILGDITRNIVGDAADVVVLMEANADPHSFGVSAHQAGQMEQAQLIVFNGLGLEEGVLAHIDSAKEQGVPALEVGVAVNPLAIQDAGSAGTPDPHFWTDPQRVVMAVDAIEDAVAQHVSLPDPGLLHSNAAIYGAQVAALDQWMATEFAALAPDRRKIITNHHVFGYLAHRFGLEVIGAVMPSGTTLAAPSAADLFDLATTVRDAGVPAIFADTSQPDKLVRVLAEEANVKVLIVPLFSESLSVPGEGAGSYLEMMRTNTSRMTAALSS